MGHFLGVWSLSEGLQEHGLRTGLDDAARRLGGQLSSFDAATGSVRFVQFHTDDGAMISSPGPAMTCGVGDPLHPDRQLPTQSASVKALRSDLIEFRVERLARMRGQFVACHVDPESGLLVLIGDRLGVRPIFLWRTDSVLAFSTSYSALLALRDGPVTAISKSVWEIMALGYALENRTLSADIELLPVGTALVASRSLQFRRVFPELQAGILTEPTDEELVEELDARFTDAIRIRTMERRGQRQVAFLSGGMDSRAIVSKLLQLGEQVTTINVAPPGTLDAELGRQAASRLGSRYRHFDLTSVPGRLGVLLQHATQKVWAEEETIPSARSVWSGDGGSVILGCVYLTQTVLDLAAHHEWDSVARLLLEQMGAGNPLRLLGREYRERAGPVFIETVDSMIRKSNTTGAPSELPYLFLLRTDQRRHLHRYYSQSGPGDYEPVVPFFDSEFVDWVVQVPIERKLNHGLYHQWFASGVLSPAEEVPWQTYPGHEVCPLPLPSGLADQWSSGSAWYPERMQRKIGRRTALQAANELRRSILPNSQLDMRYASFALAASLIGFGRWRHVPAVLTRLSGP